MKPLHDFSANLIRLGAFVAAVSAAAATLPSDWRREQSFELSTNGLVKLSLPVETLDSARPGLEDLRLFNEEGNEIPFLISRPAPSPKIVQSARSFQVALNPVTPPELLERLAREEMDRLDLEDARAALKEAEEKGTVPLRDLMRDLGD